MVLVPDLKRGQLYGFRAFGEFKPEQGLRFDSGKVLLDPYALAVAIPKTYSRTTDKKPAMKSIVVDPSTFDTGRATTHCNGRSSRRLPMRCMCAASRAIQGSGVAPGNAGT